MMNADSAVLSVIISERMARHELESELAQAQSQLIALQNELERVQSELEEARAGDTE